MFKRNSPQPVIITFLGKAGEPNIRAAATAAFLRDLGLNVLYSHITKRAWKLNNYHVAIFNSIAHREQFPFLTGRETVIETKLPFPYILGKANFTNKRLFIEPGVHAPISEDFFQ